MQFELIRPSEICAILQSEFPNSTFLSAQIQKSEIRIPKLPSAIWSHTTFRVLRNSAIWISEFDIPKCSNSKIRIQNTHIAICHLNPYYPQRYAQFCNLNFRIRAFLFSAKIQKSEFRIPTLPSAIWAHTTLRDMRNSAIWISEFEHFFLVLKFRNQNLYHCPDFQTHKYGLKR